MKSLGVRRLSGAADGRVLVLGPSIGTVVDALWGPVLPLLPSELSVWGWDLPGHGRAAPRSAFTFVQLAEELLVQLPHEFVYAGVSAAGAVGMEIALLAPDRVHALAAISTGAYFGGPGAWTERIAMVAGAGTDSLRSASADRWFSPGFEGGETIVDALAAVDDTSYIAACRALAAHDVRNRLPEITSQVLAIAGRDDVGTPVAMLAEIAEGASHGRLVVLDGVRHLPTVEVPRRTAELVIELLSRSEHRRDMASTFSPALGEGENV